MAQIQFVFQEVNASLQVGDIAYFTSCSGVSQTEFSTAGSLITQLGPVSNITQAGVGYGGYDMNGNLIESGFIVTCTVSDNITYNIPSSSFIFFSKDNLANTSSVLGYFGEVKFKNDSMKKAELFAVACDISESSK